MSRDLELIDATTHLVVSLQRSSVKNEVLDETVIDRVTSNGLSPAILSFITVSNEFVLLLLNKSWCVVRN